MSTTLITDVRVFDGEQILPRAGDPTTDITDIRSIAASWRRGVRLRSV